jgi:YHS domain-containing protein
MKLKNLLMIITLIASVVIMNNVSYSQSENKCKCENCKCADGKCMMEAGKCMMDSAKCDMSDMKCMKGDSCKMMGQEKCCGDKKDCKMKDGCKEKDGCKMKNAQSFRDSVKLCPVTGEVIEGEGAKFSYMGKEYTFCCGGCVEKFKKDPASYIKDEIRCPVTGESADKEVSTVYNGTKYYFCCPSCIKKFEAEPDKYLNKN